MAHCDLSALLANEPSCGFSRRLEGDDALFERFSVTVELAPPPVPARIRPKEIIVCAFGTHDNARPLSRETESRTSRFFAPRDPLQYIERDGFLSEGLCKGCRGEKKSRGRDARVVPVSLEGMTRDPTRASPRTRTLC